MGGIAKCVLTDTRHPHFTVGHLLGHSSVAFTLDVYTGDWDEGAAQAATALGEALDL